MPCIPGPAAEPSAALDSAAEASAVNEVKLRAAVTVKWYKPFGGNKRLPRDRDKDYNLKALARASVLLYVRVGGGEGGGGWRERTERGGVLRAEGGGKHATWQGQRVARDSWCWYVGFVGS